MVCTPHQIPYSLHIPHRLTSACPTPALSGVCFHLCMVERPWPHFTTLSRAVSLVEGRGELVAPWHEENVKSVFTAHRNSEEECREQSRCPTTTSHCQPQEMRGAAAACWLPIVSFLVLPLFCKVLDSTHGSSCHAMERVMGGGGGI